MRGTHRIVGVLMISDKVLAVEQHPLEPQRGHAMLILSLRSDGKKHVTGLFWLMSEVYDAKRKR